MVTTLRALGSVILSHQETNPVVSVCYILYHRVCLYSLIGGMVAANPSSKNSSYLKLKFISAASLLLLLAKNKALQVCLASFAKAVI